MLTFVIRHSSFVITPRHDPSASPSSRILAPHSIRHSSFVIRHSSFLSLCLAFLCIIASSPSLVARDVFVLLSGGDSPLDNNYSQYLQARAIAAFFERNYPRDSVWTFFGAGNTDGKPFISDVRRKLKRDGLTLDSWLPGTLNRNQPAKRDVIIRAFREEILPAVADGGTLFLFVGDHGTRPRGDDSESIINLWTLDRDSDHERGWRSNSKETLGVKEFRQILADGIGKGKIVFCMTQCHAGGFHYLAVPREPKPNAAWFTVTPDWLDEIGDPDLLDAAGFTATDEFSPAAGCDPDPDPDNWAGYERFFPENLLGIDLFTLEQRRKPSRSFAQAHVNATLVDTTIDKPYSTSEQYLERWAHLIETRLTEEPNLTETAKKHVEAFHRAVDAAPRRVSDAAFRERQASFRRLTQRLAEQGRDVRELLLNGTRQDLERAIEGTRRREPPQPRAQVSNDNNQAPQVERSRPSGRSRSGRSQFGEIRRLWNDSIRPAWKSAIDTGSITDMHPAAVEFEKQLLNDAPRGRDYLFAGGDTLAEEVYWRSGYSTPETLNQSNAEAIARWALERRTKILEWAKTSDNDEVRTAAERISEMRFRRRPESPQTSGGSNSQPRISRQTAAERTLFYRRTLAAWEFLLAINERPALDRLRELIAIENTPLPRPAAR